MKHILSCQNIGGQYSKWIVILQDFNLEFEISKSKTTLAFIELVAKLPQIDEEFVAMDPLPYESLFLISNSDPWYGDILLYIQPRHFQPQLSHDDHQHICHQS